MSETENKFEAVKAAFQTARTAKVQSLIDWRQNRLRDLIDSCFKADVELDGRTKQGKAYRRNSA